MNQRMSALLSLLAVLSLCTVGATYRRLPTSAAAHVAPLPAVSSHIVQFIPSLKPPTTADCVQQFQIRCYSPNQYQQAYNVHPLYSKGVTGTGRTIVLVDPFGSPTIRQDLQTFDRSFGLADPPSFQIIQPVGPVPPYNPNDSNRVGWAIETTLDVEAAHAMAPGANILLVETPVNETEGVTGFPEIVAAENYVIDHHMGDVISQSFTATEATFPNAASLLALRSAFYNARQHHVTVLAGSGDWGSTGLKADGTCCYTHRVTSWPSSDPLVTSVGGTHIFLDSQGNRYRPDVVWNGGVDGQAAGGGRSSIFARPPFQDSVANEVGYQRGTPDISLSADRDGGLIVYSSFAPIQATYGVVGGTSLATPLFAGIVALADQAAGRALGDINPRLYNLKGSHSGIIDITSGNNAYTFTTVRGQTVTVPGFAAQPGYDLASGLGTIDAATFVPALVAAPDSTSQ